jgi:hypothetical protein
MGFQPQEPSPAVTRPEGAPESAVEFLRFRSSETETMSLVHERTETGPSTLFSDEAPVSYGPFGAKLPQIADCSKGGMSNFVIFGGHWRQQTAKK